MVTLASCPKGNDGRSGLLVSVISVLEFKETLACRQNDKATFNKHLSPGTTPETCFNISLQSPTGALLEVHRPAPRPLTLLKGLLTCGLNIDLSPCNLCPLYLLSL